MDEFKLKRLLPRKSTTCIDEFEFTRRIHAEHLFTSVDEAFEYLDAVIDNKSLNITESDKPITYLTCKPDL